MLFECCNRRFPATQTLPLYPDEGYINRTLYVAKCPVCGNPKATLKEFDIINDKWVIDRNKPKRIKHFSEWIGKLENAFASSIPTKKIKYGNKSNMAFIFGKTTLTPNGVIHSGFDWNGTLRKSFPVSADFHS